MGPRGHGAVTSALLGSVSSHFVHHAAMAVLFVHAAGNTRALRFVDRQATTHECPEILAGDVEVAS